MLRPLTLWVALLLLLLTSIPVSAQESPIDVQAREIARKLQCPVCENLSVEDSDSALAGEMREIIRQKLRAGESEEEIVQYFVDRYGEGILLDPPKRDFSLLLWLWPVLMLAIGVTVVGIGLKKWLSRPPSQEDLGEVPPEELARLEARLERDLKDSSGGISP